MSGKEHFRLVMGWLVDLASLTDNPLPADELEPKLTALTAALAGQFPAAAFTRESLLDVAEHCRSLMAYAEVHRALGAWWRENRPAVPALPPPAPPPPPEPPTEAARAAASEIVRRLAAELLTTAERKTEAHRPAPPNGDTRSGHLSDGQLIATYEKLAAEGNLAALTRLAALRKKLGQNS